MSNTNQNDRHVEILAVETTKRGNIVTDKQPVTLVLSDAALTAIQRAVEEETKELRQSAQLFLTSLEEAQSELTTLRTELERVRGIIERIKNLNRYHIDVEDYGDDGCSLAVDIDKEGQWVGYDDIIETLEGGGDGKPQHKGGCHIYMQGGECNCDLL